MIHRSAAREHFFAGGAADRRSDAATGLVGVSTAQNFGGDSLPQRAYDDAMLGEHLREVQALWRRSVQASRSRERCVSSRVEAARSIVTCAMPAQWNRRASSLSISPRPGPPALRR